jgi:hypothetical protein
MHVTEAIRQISAVVIKSLGICKASFNQSTSNDFCSLNVMNVQVIALVFLFGI